MDDKKELILFTFVVWQQGGDGAVQVRETTVELRGNGPLAPQQLEGGAGAHKYFDVNNCKDLSQFDWHLWTMIHDQCSPLDVEVWSKEFLPLGALEQNAPN